MDRLVSPSGRVHYASPWDKARWPITVCGWPASWRWGTTDQRPVRAVTCTSCIRLVQEREPLPLFNQEVEHG